MVQNNFKKLHNSSTVPHSTRVPRPNQLEHLRPMKLLPLALPQLLSHARTQVATGTHEMLQNKTPVENQFEDYDTAVIVLKQDTKEAEVLAANRIDKDILDAMKEGGQSWRAW